MGLQPATTAGRAEARTPGLPILGSPGGQKALEPHSRQGDGALEKGVAAPNTKKKQKEQQETERERKKNSKPPANRTPKPKKDRTTAGARPQKKPGAKRRPQERKADFSRPRQNTAEI